MTLESRSPAHPVGPLLAQVASLALGESPAGAGGSFANPGGNRGTTGCPREQCGVSAKAGVTGDWGRGASTGQPLAPVSPAGPGPSPHLLESRPSRHSSAHAGANVLKSPLVKAEAH